MGWFKKLKKKVKKKLKKAVKAVVRVVKAISHRVAGALDFVASLVGIRPTKYLRLKIFILTDPKNRPVQTVSEVQRWADETRKILKDKMNVELHTPHLVVDDMVNVIEEPAPIYALGSNCGAGDAFGDAADYYEEHSTYTVSSATSIIADLLGYGEPIFAFVITSIDNGEKSGCAIPVLNNYCTIDNHPKTTTLAHEIGHLCWLNHSDGENNLMNPDRDDMDSDISSWQISIFRNSRYVTYLHH